MNKLFFTDVQSLRSNARKHIDQGAITVGYAANKTEVLKLLNDALATEIVCVLRYRRHHFMARGIRSNTIAKDFLEHSIEEQAHADLIAARIIQLGGEPDFSPNSLSTRSHAEYIEGDSLIDMIKENLIAERIAIDSYKEMITYIGEDDSTTSDLLKHILATEEEHADELADLLADVPIKIE